MPTQLVDAAALRAEMEQDLAWRDDELRFMENQAAGLPEPSASRYRRAMVLLVYAHLEGFVKFAFVAYANAINGVNLSVGDVEWSIAASSLTQVFSRMRDGDRKSEIFRSTLPDDSKLHRFCRDRDFLEQLKEFEKLPVGIPVDEVVDTESNIKPVVLKKMLYRLGLDEKWADGWAPDLNRLLQARNGIAHGELRDVIDSSRYQRARQAARALTNGIMIALFQAARDGKYLRT